jgi:RNA polymerase sigma-70 factor (ECF subfamily)
MNSCETNFSVASGDPGREEAFRALVSHRTMLATYIRSVVGDYHLAEDVLSETCITIVRAWPKFDQSRDFGNWARGVARRVALSMLRREKRAPTPVSDEALNLLGAEMGEVGSEAALADRMEKLRICMEKLPESHRDLVRRRFFEHESYEQISDITSRSVPALYMAFSRILSALAICFQRQTS